MKALPEWASMLPGNEGYLALSYLLDMTPGEVRARRDLFLPETMEERYEEIVRRRKTGEPLQYAIGVWEFYGHSFLVDERALIPRPETELLVEWVLEETLEGKVIADIGTGTGAIGLTLAMEGEPAAKRVILTDISKAALALAKENAQRFRLDAKGPMLQWVEGDGPMALVRPVDIIVSNPPYIDPAKRPELQKELTYEPENALYAGEPGGGGTALIRSWIPELSHVLCPEGVVFFEIGDRQGMEIKEALEKQGFSQVTIKKDYSGRDRMVRARLSARGGEHV